MREHLVDFITSLDVYASGEGWPGFWGLEGPEYLAWLGQQPDVSYLIGAKTYHLVKRTRCTKECGHRAVAAAVKLIATAT